MLVQQNMFEHLYREASTKGLSIGLIYPGESRKLLKTLYTPLLFSFGKELTDRHIDYADFGITLYETKGSKNVVACAMARRISDGGIPSVHVCMVGVVPTHRGQGLCRFLYKCIEEMVLGTFVERVGGKGGYLVARFDVPAPGEALGKALGFKIPAKNLERKMCIARENVGEVVMVRRFVLGE